MTQYFAVLRGPGPRWDASRPRREREGWAAQAEFMNGLSEAGFVVLGGPLDETRALLIIDATAEDEIAHRLVADPWKGDGDLVHPVRRTVGDPPRPQAQTQRR
jgi:hypothetical protein